MVELNLLELIENIEIIEKKLNLALSYSGLRLPQYRAMVFLEKAGKTTVSDLGRQQGVTPATASVLVASLKKAGHIVSVDNKSDKRSFYIKLTDSGLTRLQLAKREVSLVEQKINQQIPEDVVLVLKKLTRVFHKQIK